MSTVLNFVASFLTGLTATAAPCDALGTTLRLASTLFLGQEPNKDRDLVTLIPYPGEPPDTGMYKYSSNVQIRTKTDSVNTGLNTQQAFIKQLHMNELNGRGLCQSLNSAPLIISTTEGGEKTIIVTNYSVKHLRI